jgi:PhnB protein
MQITSIPKPVPEGYHTVTVYLMVNGASDLLSFMKEVFGAKEKLKFELSNGKITHGEATIGDSIVMFADTPEKSQPMPTMLHLYLEDVDTVYERAMKAGAISLRKPEDRPYGDRMAGLKDRWGNQWWVATHIKDLTVEEMQKRIEESRNNKK